MPNDFDRIEDERDLTAGLAWERHLDREVWSDGLEATLDGAYDISDPKHPDHHDVYADWSDAA